MDIEQTDKSFLVNELKAENLKLTQDGFKLQQQIEKEKEDNAQKTLELKNALKLNLERSEAAMNCLKEAQKFASEESIYLASE